MEDSKRIVFIKWGNDTDPDIAKKTKEEWKKFLSHHPEYREKHDRELGLYKNVVSERLSERFGPAAVEISEPYLDHLVSHMGYKTFSSKFGSYLDLYEAFAGEGTGKFSNFVKASINFYEGHCIAADLWGKGHVGTTESEFLRAKSDVTEILYGEMRGLLDIWKDAGSKFAEEQTSVSYK